MQYLPRKFCLQICLTGFLALRQISCQSIPVGGAYVGCGYDMLFGNPDGASFTNGGVDPGLKPAKFILQKTFTKAVSGYCPNEATCVEIGGTYSEEVFSIHADMQQYKRDYSALWSYDGTVNLLLASFGGTLSYSSQEAKQLIETQEKVIITRRKVTTVGDATYNHRQNRKLNQEFVDSLCELPADYSAKEYKDFLYEWGTHVVIAAKLGVRESTREEYSKKVVINHLQRNQSGILTNKGGALGFISSSLTGEVSSAVISDLKSGTDSLRRWISATGSPFSPAPIALTLRGLDSFINFDALQVSNACSDLQSKSNISRLKQRIQQALADYPNNSEAIMPGIVVREMNITWPKGSYGLLMAHDGCPAGPWSTGHRFEDTQDYRPSNDWSPGFSNRTASDLWYNNLTLKFCMKTIEFDDGALDLAQGAYCIFKKGQCPFGFESGSLYIDDEDFYNINTFDGVLPDGIYDRNSKYFFCCRDDGAVNKPIYLPTEVPFILMPVGPACQKVSQMKSELHFLKIDGMGKGKSGVDGKVPLTTQDQKNNWTIHFCYYFKYEE